MQEIKNCIPELKALALDALDIKVHAKSNPFG
jgi:hypothetical protein